jgi:peptidoglycan/LPS O-acetylase OafA/YrhL
VDARGLRTIPSTGRRLPGIEGLRAVAACSVVAVHVWGVSMPDGERLWSTGSVGDAVSTLSAGLTLFFTLSGFLLYRPFAAAIAGGRERQSFAAYFRNRFLRIVPAYWVILLVTALVLGAASVRSPAGELGVGRLTDPLGLGQSLLLVQDYRPSTVVIGIGPAWSLAVELVFYLSLPLFVLMAASLARRATGHRRRIAALLAPAGLLLLIGLSGKLAAWHLVAGGIQAGYEADWPSVVERSFWAQADLFAFGMLAAVLHVEVTNGRVTLPRGWRIGAAALAVLVFVPCALTMGRGEHSYLLQNTGEALAIAIALAAITIPDRSRARGPWIVRLLESPVFVAVGVASYSLFLWHYPVILWLREHGLTSGAGAVGLALNLLLVGAVAGALTALTYRYVERPALRRKRRARPTPSGRRSPSRPRRRHRSRPQRSRPADRSDVEREPARGVARVHLHARQRPAVGAAAHDARLDRERHRVAGLPGALDHRRAPVAVRVRERPRTRETRRLDPVCGAHELVRQLLGRDARERPVRRPV